MNIIKQTGGNVILVDAAGNILKSFVNVNALDIVSSNEIIIKYGYNQWSGIFADKIQNTQVEPAAAIPFSGDAYALASLLSSDFFYQNIIIMANQVIYDNTISGLTATNVQDAIDELATDLIYTVELVDALTVDFYAPYDLKINSVTDILNTPVTTIDDDGVPYTLTNTIAVGSKITVTVDTAAVVNLNVEKV